jgi:hypothetical protein
MIVMTTEEARGQRLEKAELPTMPRRPSQGADPPPVCYVPIPTLLGLTAPFQKWCVVRDPNPSTDPPLFCPRTPFV